MQMNLQLRHHVGQPYPTSPALLTGAMNIIPGNRGGRA